MNSSNGLISHLQPSQQHSRHVTTGIFFFFTLFPLKIPQTTWSKTKKNPTDKKKTPKNKNKTKTTKKSPPPNLTQKNPAISHLEKSNLWCSGGLSIISLQEHHLFWSKIHWEVPAPVLHKVKKTLLAGRKLQLRSDTAGPAPAKLLPHQEGWGRIFFPFFAIFLMGDKPPARA